MANFLTRLRPLFPGQQPNEHIYLITRPHWITLALKIAVWFVFVVVLFYLDAVVFPRFSEFSGPAQALPAINLFKSVYMMFLLAGLFTIWILYYLNFQIITNQRVVDIDQKNILYHMTSELHLFNLQDVSVEVKGILATFFDYGTVYIQTAGANRNFEFDHIPNPHAVAKLILDLYEKLPAEQKAKNKYSGRLRGV